MAGCLLLAACSAPLTTDPRPWEKGSPYEDARLLKALTPNVPTTRSGLFMGSDQRIYAVFELETKPARDYPKAYWDHIRQQGVITSGSAGGWMRMLPVPSKGRSVIPYNSMVIFSPGNQGRFSLFHAEFVDSDEAWSKAHPFRDLPDQVSLDELRLVVRVGCVSDPWREEVIIPDRDLVDQPDPPFGRYPGSFLVETTPGEYDTAYRYVVSGASGESVIGHYEGRLRSMGAEGIRSGDDTVSASVEGRGVHIRWESRISFRHGTESTARLRRFPNLMASLPGGSSQVLVWFKKAER